MSKGTVFKIISAATVSLSLSNCGLVNNTLGTVGRTAGAVVRPITGQASNQPHLDQPSAPMLEDDLGAESPLTMPAFSYESWRHQGAKK